MLARREIGRALQYRAAAGWSRLLSRTRVTRARGVWSLLHVMQGVQRRNVSRAGLTITVYGGAPGEIGGNRISLEWAARRWLLDFGMRFGPTGRFFEESCR